MESNKVGLILGAMVAVLLLGSLTVPIIMDYADGTIREYKNSGAYAAYPSESTDIAIVFGDSVTYQAADYELSVPSGVRALIIGENLSVYRYYGNGIVVSGVDSSDNVFYSLAKVVNATLNGTSATISYGETSDALTTVTIENAWQYFRNETGECRFIDNVSSTRDVYIENINDIRGSSIITSDTDVFYSFEGSSVKVYGADLSTATATVTISDVDVDVQSFAVHPDRETEGSYTFNVTVDGTEDAVYPLLMVVPNIVESQTSNDAASVAVLMAIPVLLIVALLLAIVAGAFNRY